MQVFLMQINEGHSMTFVPRALSVPKQKMEFHRDLYALHCISKGDFTQEALHGLKIHKPYITKESTSQKMHLEIPAIHLEDGQIPSSKIHWSMLSPSNKLTIWERSNQ